MYFASARQLRGPDQTRILAHAQRLGAAADAQLVRAVSDAGGEHGASGARGGGERTGGLPDREQRPL